jgi:peptidyl-prolyl cis-trans isomerase D
VLQNTHSNLHYDSTIEKRLVIALVFIFWGVGANMMDTRQAAIVVNDEEISYQEYQRIYDQLLSSYRQQFGGSVPEELLKSLGISEQVQSQLIQQTLLRQGAASMGLLVSEPEVQQDIQNMVQFQENDSFNLEKYKTILSSNRLTPHKYEVSRRVDMLSTKGVQAIGNFATTVTDAEINDLYQQSKESVTLHFAKISPSHFTDKVTIEEAPLAAWFDQNKENYKSDPKVQLKFLSFSYKNDSESDSEQDKAAATTKRSAVFQQANEAYEGIISAGSLQEYAKLHSEAAILETDFFSHNNPPAILDKAPAVQNKAFSLKVGELSSLIESPAGYSILYAEAIQAPEIPALESVRDEVTKDYRSEQARELAREKSEEILAALKSGTLFSEITQANEIELKEATLSRNAPAPEGSEFPPSLLMDVFSLSDTNPLPDEPAQVAEDTYLYQFSKRTLPDAAAMTDEEKEQLKTQILSAKQERILVAWIRHQEKEADIFTNKNLQ